MGLTSNLPTGTPMSAAPLRSISAGLAVVVLLTSCATAPGVPDMTGEAVSPGAGAEWPTIVVGRTALHDDSTVAIALQEGWFEEAGLNVVVIEGRSTVDVVPPLLSGEVDVIVGGLSPALVTAIAQGADVRMVATGTVADPAGCTTYGMMMLPEARQRFDLSMKEDVARLRLGGPFNAGFIAIWFAEELAASVGLTLDDLDLVDVPSAQAGATLVAGGVDAVIALEPGITLIEQELGGELVVPVSAVLPGRVLTGMFMGPRLLADPELAARYLAVHLRAVARHAEGGTERNVAAVSGPTGLEPSVLRAMCWSRMDTATRPYVDAVQDAFLFAQRMDRLDAVPDPDAFWAHDIRERALEILAAADGPAGG
jgi:ABC-type nitrate/sulfonate/bicarbonate transport system substrate-binding protein